MTAKQLLFGESAHARLVKGMNTLADAVRVTLGPKASSCSFVTMRRRAHSLALE
jgi:chaperonin GroEL (HSP60 family)